jgi:VanZ family protein
MRLARFVRYWVPAIVWMALIFIGSTDVLSAEHTSRFVVPFLRWIDPQISVATLDVIQFGIRKVGHLAEYAILSALLWHGLRRGTSWRMRMSILFMAVWFACAVFAASDEFHQSFVPSRTASPEDVLVDICGALIGLLIALGWSQRANRKSAIAKS